MVIIRNRVYFIICNLHYTVYVIQVRLSIITFFLCDTGKIMNRETLLQLVQYGESETLEFKKSTAQLKAICETLCAFLNHQGGTVLVGVDDKGQLFGQDVTDNTRQELAKEIAKIEPTIHVDTHYLSLDNGKTIIILAVASGQYVPYAYAGRAFVRIQSTTSLMSQPRYQQLLNERISYQLPWELLPAQHLSLSDLDTVFIEQVIKEGVNSQRLPPEALTEPLTDVLSRLKLMQNGQLNNAAAVLFAKAMSPIYLQCQLKAARFVGTDKLGDYLDNKIFSNNAFSLLAEAETFIRRHLPIASFFQPDSFIRDDKPALPALAVREALINAICHRDYSAYSGYIALAIYDDRLEIWNAGSLPSSITLDDLKKTHLSQPRNEKIANVFFLRGYIETWGTGTNKIFKLCQEANLPEPEYQEYSGGISITFRFNQPFANLKAVVLSADTKEAILNTLTLRQKNIFKLLNQHHALTLRELASQLVDPPALRTLGDDLATMKELKLVEVKGRAKNARWILKK